MATTASKYQPGSRGPLRRTVDRRGVDGAATPAFGALPGGSWVAQPSAAGPGRPPPSLSDAEPVHDRLDVDVLNLNGVRLFWSALVVSVRNCPTTICGGGRGMAGVLQLSLIHISEPTR